MGQQTAPYENNCNSSDSEDDDLSCYFAACAPEGNSSHKVDVQGSQLNAPTTEFSNTPLRDVTPDVQVEETVNIAGEQELDPCHPCNEEPLAAATLEPDVEVRARPHRQ